MPDHLEPIRSPWTALLDRLEASGSLRTDAVRRAMEDLPRALFLPDRSDEGAVRASLSDRPVAILEGQTISAPHMVAILLEETQLSSGHRVLEVGAGSGWLAAIAAELVGPEGHLTALEVLPSLVSLAQENVEAVGLSSRVNVLEADGSKGWPRGAPYDRIIVSCGAPNVPQALVDELAPGGRLVIPVGGRRSQVLKVVERTKEGLEAADRGACAFVPMVGEEAW